MLKMSIGEVVRFNSSWEYRGPAYAFARIRVSIGKRIAGIFEEKLFDDTGINVPLTSAFIPLSLIQVITLTSKLSPGETYGIEAKIYEGTGAGQKIYAFFKQDDAIHITEEPKEVEFQNLQVSIGKS